MLLCVLHSYLLWEGTQPGLIMILHEVRGRGCILLPTHAPDRLQCGCHVYSLELDFTGHNTQLRSVVRSGCDLPHHASSFVMPGPVYAAQI